MPKNLVRTLAKRRSPLVIIDLSERITRAMVLQWEEQTCLLRDYAFLEAPGLASTLSRAQLAEHLKKLGGLLAVKAREVVLVIGMQDAQVRTVELPNSPDTSFRVLLKRNTNKFFKQDPDDFVVDCVPLALANPNARGVSREAQVLGVGLGEKLFRLLLAAAKDAGLKVIRLAPTQVGLANAVRLSRPQAVDQEVTALVDVGPRTCAISALIKGQPAFSRVVELDEALNAGLDEAFATPYPVAAEIRTNLIRTRLQKLLFPLGRDISAAIDFFEAQANCRITSVLFAGGSERSDLIAETLQGQLDVPCQRIEPAPLVKIDVPNGKAERALRDLPRLAGAIGAAAAAYLPELVQINFLAERFEAIAQRRRDPVRYAVLAAAAAIALMAAWAGYTNKALSRTVLELRRLQGENKSAHGAAAAAARAIAEGRKTFTIAAAMEQHATNRFFAAATLNALQEVVRDEIHVVHLSLQQNLQYVPPVKAGNTSAGRTPAKKAYIIERVALSIQAKNFAGATAADAFMDRIAAQSWFAPNLRPVNPVTLKSRSPRQVDPLDPSIAYTLFTIDCAYPERILGYE